MMEAAITYKNVDSTEARVLAFFVLLVGSVTNGLALSRMNIARLAW